MLFKHFILFFLLLIFQLKLEAQIETRASVVNRIEQGVKLLSEKEYVKSIEELVLAKEIATTHQWHLQRFNAVLNIGTNYYLLMDYGEAFHYYFQAYEIAIEHLEKPQQMAVFNNIGALYGEEKDLLNSKESFLNAYNIAKEIDDKERIGTYGINLAIILNELGELVNAKSYIDEALPNLVDSPNVLLLAKLTKAENYFLKNQLLQSKQIALEILPIIKSTSLVKSKMTIKDKISVLLLLAKIHLKENEFNKAKKYALMARAKGAKIESRVETYNTLANIFHHSNEYQYAMVYKDSVIMAKDTLHTIKNTALYKSEKVKFQIKDYKQRLLQSKVDLDNEKYFFYKLILGITIFMGFLIWVYKNNSLKHEQRKKIVELELIKEKSEHLIAEKQHREQEALVLLEKEQLKNELDSKNRDLTAKAMYIASKNELLEEVIQSLSTNSQIIPNSELRKQISELKNHVRKDSYWDSFTAHFEELNRGFLNRLMLKHPDLTANDIRFLTFNYMNLSNKEMGSLLNITPQSCRKRKERISKKMGVLETLSLHAYLSSI